MKQLVFTAKALRTLDRMPVNVSQRIRAKLAQYAANPSALSNNVKALTGQEGMLRMRIGEWRVLLTETGQIVRIVRIAPRGSAYDRL